PAGEKALVQLLRTARGDVQRKALQVAGLVKLKESADLRALRRTAMQAALDEKRPLKERLASLTPLPGASLSELTPLQALFDARQPIELQLAAVGLFGAGEGPEVVAILLRDWPKRSPRMQAAILDAICSRKERLPLVLDALEKKLIDPASLPAIRQTQLLENSDPLIRRRARALFAARISDDRKPVLEKYKIALTLRRDSAKGKAVFEKQCLKCHQLNGRGFLVGPDLAAVQNRPDESLLIDILDPSSVIVAGFRAYNVSTRSGRIFTGVLAAQTATSIQLRKEEGAQAGMLPRRHEG